KSAHGSKSFKEGKAIEELINASGRLDFEKLEAHARNHSEQAFVQLLKRPLLVGISLYTGQIERGSGGDAEKTAIFVTAPVVPPPPTEGGDAQDEGRPEAGFAIEQAIYPLVKSRFAEAPPGVFPIGRTQASTLVISDYAISEQHAEIVSHKGVFSIRDCGSTNGTMLNGTPLGKEAKPLREGDDIKFGRYMFKFMTPSALYAKLNGLMVDDIFARLMNGLGKADFRALERYAKASQEQVFTQLVTHPVLIGSALFKGQLDDDDVEEDAGKTRFFVPDKGMQAPSVNMHVLERNIYPLVKGSDMAISSGSFVIGRSPEADLRMPDPSISDHHAEIRFSDEGDVFIRDLGSTNGTRLNDTALSKTDQPLNEGDEIRFGRFQFTFLYPSSLFARLAQRV
ncbi:MAG: FHA domain-containing protein, partial [Magnetococcales bacterium]|nr:FHA domain-containing protein [Magnetococcales bacterium]